MGSELKLWMLAGKNLFVTDNDIYSSGDVVSTLNNGAAGAEYMHVRNTAPLPPPATRRFGAKREPHRWLILVHHRLHGTDSGMYVRL